MPGHALHGRLQHVEGVHGECALLRCASVWCAGACLLPCAGSGLNTADAWLCCPQQHQPLLPPCAIFCLPATGAPINKYCATHCAGCRMARRRRTRPSAPSPRWSATSAAPMRWARCGALSAVACLVACAGGLPDTLVGAWVGAVLQLCAASLAGMATPICKASTCSPPHPAVLCR